MQQVQQMGQMQRMQQTNASLSPALQLGTA